MEVSDAATMYKIAPEKYQVQVVIIARSLGYTRVGRTIKYGLMPATR